MFNVVDIAGIKGGFAAAVAVCALPLPLLPLLPLSGAGACGYGDGGTAF